MEPSQLHLALAGADGVMGVSWKTNVTVAAPTVQWRAAGGRNRGRSRIWWQLPRLSRRSARRSDRRLLLGRQGDSCLDNLLNVCYARGLVDGAFVPANMTNFAERPPWVVTEHETAPPPARKSGGKSVAAAMAAAAPTSAPP